jgi:hypothetical protein
LNEVGKRTVSSHLTHRLKFSFPCNIKDLLAVQGVLSEPVSPEFPVKQGKNREFSRISPIERRPT